MDPSKARVPPMMDMTIDNITANTVLINSQGPDVRLTFVLERLVRHMHDFARETRLSSKEWMAGIHFLTEVGHTCTDVRQEFILLSDILGLSLLVDSIDHPKPLHSTEGSVLGPFHSHKGEHKEHGEAISHDQNGEPLLVLCTVKDSHGKPVEGVKADIWETNSSGRYDVQYADRDGPDGRVVIKSKDDGSFWFKAIKPVPYPIPHDGPVGKLLEKLRRHPYRPSHMHFMFEKPGYDHLITWVLPSTMWVEQAIDSRGNRALYLRGDPYETSDAVFGVKESLLVDLEPADVATAEQYSVKPGTQVLKYDFVLVPDEEANDLRDEESRKALAALGRRVQILDGLPVPDVD